MLENIVLDDNSHSDMKFFFMKWKNCTNIFVKINGVQCSSFKKLPLYLTLCYIEGNASSIIHLANTLFVATNNAAILVPI